jgi:hypothetical protein
MTQEPVQKTGSFFWNPVGFGNDANEWNGCKCRFT